VIEKLHEVVIGPWADIEEMYLQDVEPTLTDQPTFDLSDLTSVHLLVGYQDVDHLGNGPHRSTKFDISELSKNIQGIPDGFALLLLRSVLGVVGDEDVAV
jgi:hypothetical protein